MKYKPVPNYFKGRFDSEKKPISPDLIVIHVGEGTQNQIYQTFLNEQKSSHYCVSKTGEIWNFVNTGDTAWHAGFKKNPTSTIVKARITESPNSYSIGIENEGYGEDFTEAQYKANANLIKGLCVLYNIPCNSEHIIKHKEIRSDKTCPGVVDIHRIITMAQRCDGVDPTLVERVGILEQVIQTLLLIINKFK